MYEIIKYLLKLTYGLTSELLFHKNAIINPLSPKKKLIEQEIINRLINWIWKKTNITIQHFTAN